MPSATTFREAFERAGHWGVSVVVVIAPKYNLFVDCSCHGALV